MIAKQRRSLIIFVSILIVCCSLLISPAIALLCGIVLAQLTGSPFRKFTQKASGILLQVSVVGLGFGMEAGKAFEAGREGFFFTLVSISATLLLGAFVGQVFQIERKISHLISCGTAICGGSAIAAISPVVQAGQRQASV